ncbi:hypothetical protein UFOVP459_36 [uncultured Caudovirales phage]|uniref:Uncharacterized protein n=1 Tax=uncultured Caudovirales phage TaxID=2100421 RepID=A0A6J5QF07_9CAUD|nr:hypothetical protein UFOVP459_36 [uncultured Caudovirales phage]CAB4183290.1 hypothetical protein UFOVP1089_49 [uncultured Caudovirales phage]CAB4213082.1 hypothetical protein UFOVP1443_68 [uncultured Caudovirales phage]
MQFFKAEKRKEPQELAEYILFLLSYGSSQEAFDFIDKMSVEELSTEHKLKVTPGWFLKPTANQTIGTQFVIQLFDPLNGWMRAYRKRPDILKMISKLMQKGVCIDGIGFLQMDIIEMTIEKYIQRLIMKGRYGDDSDFAVLSEEIVKTFIENGYQFSYPDERYASYAAALTAKVIDTIEDKTKLPKPLLKIVASYYSDGILHTRFFDSQRRADNLLNASAEASITKSKPQF